MSKRDAVGHSYDLLVAAEHSATPFSLDELLTATGWRRQTPLAYLSKKWSNWVEKRWDGYHVSGVAHLTKDEYRRHMSQVQEKSQEPTRPDLPDNVERLVLKAQQAATLAVDIYNRPATQFRSEGYIVLMVIAWTALFHATFESDGVEYFYRNGKGDPVTRDGDARTWSLGDCLAKHFGNGSPAIRKNLEFITGLRDKIEHRYVPAVDARVSGECQAMLLNFDDLLNQRFGTYYSIGNSLSIPLQTSSLRSTERQTAMRRLQARHYDEVMEYIDQFRTELPESVYSDPKFSFRVYLVPKIGNHQTSSDIAFEFIKYDPSNPKHVDLQRQISLVKDRQIPVVHAGMHKPGGVAVLVSERLGRPFSIHNHTQAWKVYGVRGPGIQPELCEVKYCQFDTVHGDYVYTEAWVNDLVKRLSEPEEYERVVAFKE